METKDIYAQVSKKYGSITKSTTGQYEQTVAKAFGYTEEELAGVPEGANLGLGCGNPVALAGLSEVFIFTLCGALPRHLLTVKREKPSLISGAALASMSLRPQRELGQRAGPSE
jgi:hypothetical protein